jgi:hypothetical protein
LQNRVFADAFENYEHLMDFDRYRIYRRKKSKKESPVKNGQVVEGGSFFGVGADFGLQGLASREPGTLRFRLGIPSSGEP